MKTQKPIQTKYKGYKFRSRLEARWAVFFERLGLAWEYEPEGFELEDGGFYLPDFRIQIEGVVNWYEVKRKGTQHDQKFKAFDPTKIPLTQGQSACEKNFLAGDPLDALCAQPRVCPRCLGIGAHVDTEIFKEDVHVTCQSCDFDTPFGHGNEKQRGLFNVPYEPHEGTLIYSINDWAFALGCVSSAAEYARQARFEFGEAPS